MSRFNPFPKVSCTYGAPMGRYTHPGNCSHWDDPAVKLCAMHQGGSDGYDRGGAYWGSPSTVWAVWEHGHGDLDAVMYVRAGSRDAAIAKARKGDY